MNKFTSLEHMIRSIMESPKVPENTKKRREVDNVARPDDSVPTDEKSKLAKQAEIKTKIIDEASALPADDVTTNGKDDSGKGNVKDEKKKKAAESDLDDPKEIKGGKTEVILDPKTDDKVNNETGEDNASKKARSKANKDIGAKGVKEETISESTHEAHVHMKKAMKAHEAGDAKGHHMSMHNYHNVMSLHHAKAGRHHVADAHMKKADWHMNEAANLAGHETTDYEGPHFTVGPDGKDEVRDRTIRAINSSNKSSHAGRVKRAIKEAIAMYGGNVAMKEPLGENDIVKSHPVFGNVIAHPDGSTKMLGRRDAQDLADKHAKHGGHVIGTPYDKKKFMVKTKESIPHGTKLGEDY